MVNIWLSVSFSTFNCRQSTSSFIACSSMLHIMLQLPFPQSVYLIHFQAFIVVYDNVTCNIYKHPSWMNAAFLWIHKFTHIVCAALPSLANSFLVAVMNELIFNGHTRHTAYSHSFPQHPVKSVCLFAVSVD